MERVAYHNVPVCVCVEPKVPPPCESNPCKNGGTCDEDDNGYHCTCPPGWTGDDCVNREYLFVVWVYLSSVRLWSIELVVGFEIT